jgi:glucokinase
MAETSTSRRVVRAADIGGGSIRAALIDDTGRVLDTRRGVTPQDPEEGTAILRAFWEDLGPADGAALVIAGAIRPDTGELTQSPNLQRWEGFPLAERLDCRLLNDANGAVLGEAWTGALAGARSAVLLTLGTGVGGGILLDGRLWLGATGSAAEVGHIVVEPDGPPCGCGGRGCLEALASAAAVAAMAGTENAEAAAAAARAGDDRAIAAFDRAARSLGIAMASLANVLNPEAFCLGGGMAAAFDLLEPGIREEIAARAFRLAQESLRVVPATLGDQAGLLGAAYHALWPEHAG